MNREIGSSTIGSLLSELRAESSTLLRQEVALAKAELGEKAAQMGKSAIKVGTAVAVAYAGAIVLLIGLGHFVQRALIAGGLSFEVAQGLGLVLVGAVVALVGWMMLASAKKTLRASNLSPEQTLASLRDNRRWAENKIHAAHEPAP
jgi:hypothetical protein